MKKLKTVSVVSLSLLVVLSFFSGAMAAEVITAEDFVMKIITHEHLIKTADNFVVMFDSSSSMGQKFKGTDAIKYDVLRDELRKRNTYLPDLGYNAGIYVYTPWTKTLEMGAYNRDTFAAAIDTLPPGPKGPTPLQKGLHELGPVLEGLSGRTAVFLFSDGSYSKFTGVTKPEAKIRELAAKHDVCFYIISSADTPKEMAFLEDLAAANVCSRVIPFESYIDRPQYTSGALFVVKTTYEIDTLSDQKVTGLKADDVLFGFNEDFVGPDDFENLNQVGAFLKAHPEAFAVLDGYSDNTGSYEYNMLLSRGRAEAVATYLMSEAGVSADQLVVFWFGEVNPAADNGTPEGQAKNRRVEIAVGGLK